jgi:hypothetical protein
MRLTARRCTNIFIAFLNCTIERFSIRGIFGQFRTRPMQPPDFAHFFVQKTKNAKNAVYTSCHKTGCSVFPA